MIVSELRDNLKDLPGNLTVVFELTKTSIDEYSIENIITNGPENKIYPENYKRKADEVFIILK